MERRGAIAGFGLAAVYVTGVLAVDPFEDRAVGCPVHALTGGWCPGCGATRASWLLLHGDPAQALRYNLLLVPAVAFLAARWLVLAAPARAGWLPRWVRSPTEASARAIVGVAALVVAFTAARNLPTFDWLAPPET